MVFKRSERVLIAILVSIRDVAVIIRTGALLADKGSFLCSFPRNTSLLFLLGLLAAHFFELSWVDLWLLLLGLLSGFCLQSFALDLFNSLLFGLFSLLPQFLLDLMVFLGGRPGAGGFLAAHWVSWDLELNEGVQTAQKPLLDELFEHHSHFAGLRLNLVLQLFGHVVENFLELKEDDFGALDQDNVLGNGLLVPLLVHLCQFRFSSFLHNICRNHLLQLDQSWFILSLRGLDPRVVSFSINIVPLDGLKLLVDKEGCLVSLGIGLEALEFFRKFDSLSISEVPFDDFNEVVSCNAAAVQNFGFSEHVD